MKLFSSVRRHRATYSPKKLCIATAIAAATAATSLSVAQTGSGFALEEVVVTARKREESIQEVPVAVSAFSNESLKSLGVTNLKDLDGIVPGLNMGGGGNGIKGDSNPYIRGIGQRETKVTIDSAVGTYLDGIYVARASGALLDAIDIASIQVLRGPQGTLFGKNTTGGAIVIKTARPGPDFGGHVDATLGNYGRRNASMAVNIPLIENKLYSRLTLGSTKNDGIIENQLDNTDWSDDDRFMAIGQVRWDVSDAVQADFLLSHTKTRQNSRGQKCRFFGPQLDAINYLNGAIPTLENIYNGAVGTTAEERCNESGDDLPLDEFYSEIAPGGGIFGQSRYEVDTHMAASTISWDLEEFAGFEAVTVKSISGFRRTELKADEDLDGGRAGLTGRTAPTDNATDQYSQEFQFIGSMMDGRLNTTLGLYAFLEQTDGDWLQTYAAFAPDSETLENNSILLAQSQLTERETDNEAWAAFAQIDFDITDNIELTVGLRYTEETRETLYREANVYLPSIGNGVFCPDPAPGGECATFPNGSFQHSFSEPGTRPFNEWIYGYDANGSGSLEERELGLYGVVSDDRSDDAWTPSMSVKFLATDSIRDALNLDDGMLFITYSEGFRSGGVIVANGDFEVDEFNRTDGIKDLENFEPENVVNYEIGVKLDAFDSKLRANLAAFYTDYTDIQVTTTVEDQIGIPLPSIENAGEARIEGAEGEFTYIPSEKLRITASVAYTNGDYKEYLVDAVDVTGATVITDRSDEPMPRISEWTAFLAIDYFVFTDSMGTFIPSISARYTTEQYQGFDRASFLIGDELYSPEIHFLDARVTWQAPDDRTSVTMWVKNINNEDDYSTGGVPLVGVNRSSGVIYAEPRTYGIDFSYVFGN